MITRRRYHEKSPIYLKSDFSRHIKKNNRDQHMFCKKKKKEVEKRTHELQ